MRLRDQYDWVVLGDDLGALLSASMVAKLGLSVLVLPFDPPAAARTSQDGWVLDYESNYVLGLGKEGLLTHCLRHVGMTAQEEAWISHGLSPCQILSDQARITLHAERERFGNELEREFGYELSERSGLAEVLSTVDGPMDAYWKALPHRLTLKPAQPRDTSKALGKREPDAPRTLRELAHQLSRSTGKFQSSRREWFIQDLSVHEWAEQTAKRAPVAESVNAFAAFLQGVSAALSGGVCPVDDTEVGMLDVLQLLNLSKTAGSFPGGIGAFRDFLQHLAKRCGADIPPRTYCTRVFFQGGAFAGVLPSNRGSMISASGGVLGAPMGSILPLLTISRGGWLKRLKPAPKPAGWRFSISLMLHAEAIPPGLGNRAVWQEQDAPPIVIERVQPTDYRVRESGKAVLNLRTVMPMTEQSLDIGYQRLVAARLLRKVSEIIPFLEYHIAKITPDFRGQGGSDLAELKAMYGFGSLQDIPHYLLCHGMDGLGAQSGIEGFFVASHESFPELGSFGSIVAALEAVAWAAHRAGLAGPLLPVSPLESGKAEASPPSAQA